MSLDDTDIDRMIDKELRYGVACLQKKSMYPPGDTALKAGLDMGDLFDEDSLWPALNAQQLPGAMGELCKRARQTQDMSVAQAVAAMCLYSLLRMKGHHKTVKLGIHGQCLVAVNQEIGFADIPHFDPSTFRGYFDSSLDARLSQVRAIAQTQQADPALVKIVYVHTMKESLAAMGEITEGEIKAAQENPRPPGVKAWDAVRLQSLVPYLPDFLKAALETLDWEVEQTKNEPRGRNLGVYMALSLGLAQALGQTASHISRDAGMRWMEAFKHLPDDTLNRRPRVVAGKAALRRIVLNSLVENTGAQTQTPRM